MSATPRFSVIMPAYNAARTVVEAIRSVLDQSCADLELIVCDDASTDDTLAVVRSQDDRRVRVLETERNAGPGAARDRCIAAACGQWIALIDADDAWAPDRLERLLAAAGDDQCLVFDDLLICHDTPAGLKPWRRLHGSRAFGATGGRPRDVPLAQYIRSERLLIKPLLPARHLREHRVRHSQRRFGEDAEFFLKLGATGLQLRYLPQALYRYRVLPGSATAEARDWALMRQCLVECAGDAGFDAAARAAFAAKIAQLEDHETLHEVQHALMRRDLRQAGGALARRPRSLLRVPRLLLRRIGYELHRRVHGGAAR